MHQRTLIVLATVLATESAHADVLAHREPDEDRTLSVTNVGYGYNPRLGRAWLVIEYHDYVACTLDPEMCEPNTDVRVRLPGLVYDATSRAVLYAEPGKQRVVCARLVAHWYGDELRPTGACEITRTHRSSNAIDDGFETHEAKYLDTYFGVGAGTNRDETHSHAVSLHLGGSALARPTRPAPAPAPDTPAPAAAAQTEQPPAEAMLPTQPTVTAPPAATAPAKTVAVGGEGFLKPGLLAQGWYVHDIVDSNSTLSTFRLRRAELSVNGEILPEQVAYRVMIDPAKVLEVKTVTITDGTGQPIIITTPSGRISVLQDFEIKALTRYADVSIGQFKIPVSYEGYNSSSKLLLPERDLLSKTFGDIRDIGVKAAKTFEKWGYVLGLYNGAAANNLDISPQKDIALRLEAYPIRGLTLASVTYDSIGYRDDAGTKDRWEGDVRYEAGPLVALAELIVGRDVTATGTVSSRGFYGVVGYTLENPDLHGDLQPVFRAGFLDPDTDVTDNASTHVEVGVNYYITGNEMKLQASYSRTMFQATAGMDKPAFNELIAAAQVSY